MPGTAGSGGIIKLSFTHAQTQPRPYRMAYDGNGATGGAVLTDGSSPYVIGAAVTVLGNTGSLVKTGYTFAGWNTAADGSGTAYATGGTFGISASTVLYAQGRSPANADHHLHGARECAVERGAAHAHPHRIERPGRDADFDDDEHLHGQWHRAVHRHVDCRRHLRVDGDAGPATRSMRQQRQSMWTLRSARRH